MKSLTVLASLLFTFFFSCRTAYDCALGDMGEGCNVWGLFKFFEYSDDSASQSASLVAVGDNGLGYYSMDGINWIQTTVDVNGTATLYGATHTGSSFIAVGTDGTNEKAFHSSDGMNWTESTISSNCTTNAQLNDVVQGGGRLMAVGSRTTTTIPCVHYSTDNGVTWTQGSATGAPGGANVILTKVLTDGTNFFAAGTTAAGGQDVYELQSTDGIDFLTPFTGVMDTGSGKGNNLLGAFEALSINGSTLYLMLGSDEGSTPTPSTSYYGSNPTGLTANATGLFAGNTTPEIALGVAFSGTTLVAVGDNCRQDQTTDTATLNWTGTNQTIAGCTGGAHYDMVYATSKFIAVGTDGPGNAVISISATGAISDWSIQSFGTGTFRAIAAR